MYDEIFQAYSMWTAAYFNNDPEEPTLKKKYMELRAKLSQEEQYRWPI